MSLSLLTFAVPTISFLRMFITASPASYKKFDTMPTSKQTEAVLAIVTRVLKAENLQGAEHFERIQEMLKEMPENAGPKTIESLLRYRLKVVEVGTGDSPVFTTGTDDLDGKHYIAIKPDPEIEQALPFIITHEISHILNEDPLESCMIKTIASVGMAALTVFALGWSLLPALSAVILTNCITHIVCSQRAERAADDFAIKYCSKEQLEKGITFFELMKTRKANGTYFNALITWLCHPSEDSRITKIRTFLNSSGNKEDLLPS